MRIRCVASFGAAPDRVLVVGASAPPPLKSSSDFQNPIEDQQAGLEYCVNDSPPWIETCFLAFQHYITMLGTAVIAPSIVVQAMGGGDRDRASVIQVVLFVSGINSLLQTSFGTRLPAVVGSSYAYVIPALTVVYSSDLLNIYDSTERFLQSMRALQGALICASGLQIAIGFSGVWGVFSRFLCPLTVSPVILMTGLGLYQHGFPSVGKCVQIGLPQIVVILILSQYMKKIKLKVNDLPVFERFPVLIGVLLVWAYAQLLTLSGAYRHATSLGQMHCRTDRAYLIGSSPWVRVPYPLEWGNPTFSARHVFAMMAGVMISLVESTGTLYGLSRFAGATPPPSYVLSRGIGWQGVGILLDGLFGTATGSSISVENSGLVGITRVGSRRTVQVASLMMIFFSIFGKFGAILASIPIPIFAAVYCVLGAIQASSGFTFLQFASLSSLRNLVVLGLSLFLSLSVPHYFVEYTSSAGHGPMRTGADWFDGAVNAIFSSNAVLALLIAVGMDYILVSDVQRKERGEGWWSKFFKFGDDLRSQEFYKLPLNLNDYFPQG